MSNERVAVFPGSFDPPTLGHLDVVERGADLFDRIVIGILENPDKSPVLAPELRAGLFHSELTARGLGERVEVEVFSGLATHFAESRGASWILRGLRSADDLAFELPMALSNRVNGSGTVETVFLPTRPEYSHIRGSLVRQIAAGGGDLSPFVTEAVARALEA